MCWTIIQGAHTAVEKPNKELFRTIFGFIHEILQDLTEAKNSRIFAHLIDSFPTAYSVASSEHNQNRVSQSRLNDIFDIVIDHEKSVLSNLKFVTFEEQDMFHHDKFHMHQCASISTLYRRAIHNDTTEHVKKLNELVDHHLQAQYVSHAKYISPLMSQSIEKIRPYEFEDGSIVDNSLLPDSTVYTHHLKVLTRLWLYYLADGGFISIEKMYLFIEIIGYQKCWLHDLLFFTKNIQYFGRSLWYFAEFNKKDKMAFDNGEWLLKSFTIEKLYSLDYDFKHYNLTDAEINELLQYFESHGKISDGWNEKFSDDIIEDNLNRIISEIKRT